MDEISTNQTIQHLLRCLTVLNVSNTEETHIEEVLSGRAIAQIFTQLVDLSDEDELWRFAEIDIDIPKSNYDSNWRVIIDRIPMLFPPDEYDLVSNELWRFDVHSLLNYDEDVIVHVLIIFLSAAIISDRQVRPRILSVMENFPDEVKANLQMKLRDFIKLVKINHYGDATSGGSAGELKYYKAKLMELSHTVDKLKKENGAISASNKELNDIVKELQVKVVESGLLKQRLEDAELKSKYLEAALEKQKHDNASDQKSAQEFEFRADELQRQLDETLDALEREKVEHRQVDDECQALLSKEKALIAEIKEKSEKIQLAGRDRKKIKHLEQQLDTAQKRLESYVKELAEADTLRTKIATMEQLKANQDAQYRKLSEECSAAISRANKAEAELSHAKDQLKRSTILQPSDNETGSEFESTAVSLHDELSHIHVFNSDDYSRQMQEAADWKSKYEDLLSKHTKLREEIEDQSNVHNNAMRDISAKLEQERARTERAELDGTNASKRVVTLEQSVESLRRANETLTAQKMAMADEKRKLDGHLEKAAAVIRFYSDGQDSSAENLKLRNDLARTQHELESLRAKTDQHKQESCHEQRLITSLLYQHWSGETARKCISSLPLNETADGETTQRSFLARQLATSNFTASSSSAR